MNKQQLQKMKDAQETLYNILPIGSTLYFAFHSASKTGMTRYYRVFSIVYYQQGTPTIDDITSLVARASGNRLDKHCRLICFDPHQVFVNLIYLMFPRENEPTPYSFERHIHGHFEYKNMA